MISMYVLVLQGGLALGSAVWGAVASSTGVKFTLTFAAVALLVACCCRHGIVYRNPASVK